MENHNNLNNNIFPFYENHNKITFNEEETSNINESIDNSIVNDVIKNGVNESFLTLLDDEYNELENLTNEQLLEKIFEKALEKENKGNLNEDDKEKSFMVDNSIIEKNEDDEKYDEFNDSKILGDISNLNIENENFKLEHNNEEENKTKKNKKEKLSKKQKYLNKRKKERNETKAKEEFKKNKKAEKKAEEKARKLEEYAIMNATKSKIENMNQSEKNKKEIENIYRKIIEKSTIYENNNLSEQEVADKKTFYETHKDRIEFLKSLPAYKYLLIRSSLDKKFESLNSKKIREIFHYFYYNDKEFKKNFNNIQLENLVYYFNKTEHKNFKKKNKTILGTINKILKEKKEKNDAILKELLNVKESLRTENSTNSIKELFNKVLNEYKKECEENYKEKYLEYKKSDGFVSDEESLKCLLSDELYNSFSIFDPSKLEYFKKFKCGNPLRENFLNIMTNTKDYNNLMEVFKKRVFLKMRGWISSGGKSINNKINDLKKTGKLLEDGGDEFFKLIFED